MLRTLIQDGESAAAYYGDYEKAKLYAMIGDRDKAFMLLARARASRSGWLVYLAVEPALDKLRIDSRFARLVDQTISARHL
jgi:hypothetical protein